VIHLQMPGTDGNERIGHRTARRSC
jgi:hypothetical protein